MLFLDDEPPNATTTTDEGVSLPPSLGYVILAMIILVMIVLCVILYLLRRSTRVRERGMRFLGGL